MFFHAPRGTQMQWQVLEHDGRRADVLEVVPEELSSTAVIFYIHGGGFIFGSPRTHAAMAAALGKRLAALVVMPRYRRAPEAPFPAAFDDVRVAFDGLCASGVPARQIVIGGDSAGGALALALLGQLLADQADLPGAVFCFSPLTDLSYSGDSFRHNSEVEAVLPADRAAQMAEMYLQGHAADDPRASPLFANFAGAPPVWITAGDTEILRDDARRMTALMQASKVAVTYIEQRDLPHAWPIFHNILPEARQTLDDLADWIRQQLPQAGGN
ncbi:MAG: alpha/beta hydrolase fold domain-containing protein [Sulfitobacter sp.]|nr:alpha/beta hydrolase fold domain-containing protein [Sulfitobacter sp.]